MARKKPSPQGEKLLDLKRKHPEATTAELAVKLGTTASAVYQAEARLREAGHLPKLRQRATRKNGASTAGKPRTTPEAKTTATNGRVSVSIEDHLRDELAANEIAVKALEATLGEVTGELEERRKRQRRLQSAQNALTVRDEYAKPAVEVGEVGERAETIAV